MGNVIQYVPLFTTEGTGSTTFWLLSSCSVCWPGWKWLSALETSGSGISIACWYTEGTGSTSAILSAIMKKNVWNYLILNWKCYIPIHEWIMRIFSWVHKLIYLESLLEWQPFLWEAQCWYGHPAFAFSWQEVHPW